MSVLLNIQHSYYTIEARLFFNLLCEISSHGACICVALSVSNKIFTNMFPLDVFDQDKYISTFVQ